MSVVGIVGGAGGPSRKKRKKKAKELFSFFDSGEKIFKEAGLVYPEIHKLPPDEMIHYPLPEPFLIELKSKYKPEFDSAAKYIGTIGLLDQISIKITRDHGRRDHVFKKFRLKIPGERPVYISGEYCYQIEFHSVTEDAVPVLKKLVKTKVNITSFNDCMGEKLEVGDIVLHRVPKALVFGRIEKFTKTGTVFVEVFWVSDDDAYPRYLNKVKKCQQKDLIKIDDDLKNRLIMLKLSS